MISKWSKSSSANRKTKMPPAAAGPLCSTVKYEEVSLGVSSCEAAISDFEMVKSSLADVDASPNDRDATTTFQLYDEDILW